MFKSLSPNIPLNVIVCLLPAYITITTLRLFNENYAYQGETANDVLELATGLVSINVFDAKNNLLYYHNIHPPIRIRFSVKVMSVSQLGAVAHRPQCNVTLNSNFAKITNFLEIAVLTSNIQKSHHL